MRWVALAVFSIFSILLLWFRGISRSNSVSRSYFVKHLGVTIEPGGRYSKKLIAMLSKISANIGVLRDLRTFMDSSGYGITWDTVLLCWLWSIAALPVLAVGLSGNAVLMAPAAAAAAMLPVPALKIARRVRGRTVENQSSRFTGDLALYLQCGIPIERAIRLGGRDYGYPIKEHLDKVLREMDIGNPPDAALRELAGQLDDPELELIAQTIRTSCETGAEISRVMESIGKAVRERAAIKRELKTQTVQGKMSGRLVAALPLLFLALTAMVSRRTLAVLVTTVPGLIMLAISIALDVMGFIWINKILNIKI